MIRWLRGIVGGFAWSFVTAYLHRRARVYRENGWMDAADRIEEGANALNHERWALPVLVVSGRQCPQCKSLGFAEDQEKNTATCSRCGKVLRLV